MDLYILYPKCYSRLLTLLSDLPCIQDFLKLPLSPLSQVCLFLSARLVKQKEDNIAARETTINFFVRLVIVNRFNPLRMTDSLELRSGVRTGCSSSKVDLRHREPDPKRVAEGNGTLEPARYTQ